MDKEKINHARSILEKELTKEQTDSLVYWGNRLAKNGWKFETAKYGYEKSIVLILRKSGHRHWFRICRNGEYAFMPTCMDVKR